MAAAQRVDRFISTSRLVKRRVAKYYRQDSLVLPPPVDCAEFRPSPGPGGYFLLLMRLVGWKRGDIAIEAPNRLGLPLVVAGDGRDEARLRAMAGPTIHFAGRVDGPEKAALYAGCTALILPAIEDFGITPLEAMASGRPVIALGAGGVLDTVRPGVTGEFFPDQNADSLVELLQDFRPERYDPAAIRAHAEGFDAGRFRARLVELVRGNAGRPAPVHGRADAPAARRPGLRGMSEDQQRSASAARRPRRRIPIPPSSPWPAARPRASTPSSPRCAAAGASSGRGSSPPSAPPRPISSASPRPTARPPWRRSTCGS